MLLSISEPSSGLNKLYIMSYSHSFSSKTVIFKFYKILFMIKNGSGLFVYNCSNYPFKRFVNFAVTMT